MSRESEEKKRHSDIAGIIRGAQPLTPFTDEKRFSHHQAVSSIAVSLEGNLIAITSASARIRND